MTNKQRIIWLWTIAVVSIILIFSLLFILVINSNKISNFLGLASEFNSEKDDLENFQKIEKVKVAEVVDGDTIKLEDGRTVRYLNIDTPETKKPSTPVQCFGPEATQLNKALVNQKEVWILSDQQNKDRYDRILRFIFLEESQLEDISQSVNAKMVELGFARTSIYKPNDTYEDTFWSLERKAKDKNIGLWSSCSNPFIE